MEGGGGEDSGPSSSRSIFLWPNQLAESVSDRGGMPCPFGTVRLVARGHRPL